MNLVKRNRGMDWDRFLTEDDKTFLRRLGHHYLPADQNAVISALEQGINIVELHPKATMIGLSKLAILNQMVVWDRSNGPEGDGLRKALRRHWYRYFKTKVAQPMSPLFDQDPQDPRWGLNWSGRLSEAYADLVDTGHITYHDLWVEDASRMYQVLEETLGDMITLIICVEKDSLFADFLPLAKAIGARVVISGKGKNSKAATEKMIMEALEETRKSPWKGDYLDQFDYDNPIVVLTIADYDKDGEGVIAPTFEQQMLRYIDPQLVTWAHIGITPRIVEDAGYRLDDVIYQIKLSDNSYREWAADKAMFYVPCPHCGHMFLSQAAWQNGYEPIGQECPNCHAEHEFEIDVSQIGKKTQAFGLEVEAVQTSEFFAAIAHTVAQIVGWDKIIRRLREKATPDLWSATWTLRRNALEQNPVYTDIRQQQEVLRQEMNRMEEEADRIIWDRALDYRQAYVDEGDDPDLEDFIYYAANAANANAPWQPFNVYRRTQLMVQDFTQNESNIFERIARID